MKLQHYFSIILLTILSFSFTACSDDDNENMLWTVVSNSDPEFIQVDNQSTTKFDSPSTIWVKAGYKEGDLKLKCVNHNIAFSLIGPNDSYTNPDGSFSLSKLDDNTLLIHFDRDASGKEEYTDQIAIANSDNKDVVCNTFLFITRTFGELMPTE